MSENPYVGPPPGPPVPYPVQQQWRRPLQSVDGLAKAAVVLILLSAAGSVAVAWTSWDADQLMRDYYAFVPGVGDAEVEASDNVIAGISLLSLAIYVAAVIVFIIWLWRARQNSEVISPDAQHTRSQGWVIGSWFVPIVSLWFPYQVVRDVWRASSPQTRGGPGELRLVRGSGVLGWWWAAWIVFSLVANYSFYVYRREAPTEADVLADLREIAIADTISAVAGLLAAALIVLAIRQITGWQMQQLRAERAVNPGWEWSGQQAQ